ncbi:uncharacterized protein cubi_03180 [Cryptosporidium ubiquitum]|uniref:Uncharacterized protein n=1 Tax=Cryptosporidium ubiquitum TaxID=857276 RepID=A0A1J4MQ81_9CRYT|nr:uncharacterized protein cubi_03180 [Cryptosporidium ubiquitum]OII75164.1 hypothetical protein cubi_03180 [Cryptosporidium ubiquitum]
MNRILVYSLILLVLSLISEVKNQFINILPEVPSDITQEIGTCDALLLKLLATNYIPKSETNSYCSIFRNKIQKLDTPLNELSCSIFGSVLVQCDLRLAITSSEILRQYYMRSNKPNIKELYYLTTILSNLPQEISSVLGRDDIIEDSNEIINDKLSKIKKQISTNQPIDFEETSFLFGAISQLIRLGSRNSQHLKTMNTILEWQSKNSKFYPVIDLDTFVLNFSLLSKAYFFLRRPTDFEDIPILLQQMAYSISRIKVRDIKNLAVLNEYIITRRLFIDSGTYLIQGFQHTNPRDIHEKLATVLFCRLDGSPFENISLELLNSDTFKLISVPNTCEYQLFYNNNQTEPINLEKVKNDLANSIPKLKISSRSILAREAKIPILNKESSKFEVTKANIFLGEKLALGMSKIKNIDTHYNRNLDNFQFALDLQTNLEVFKFETVYQYFTAFEIKALPPYKTIGTRTIKLIPTIIEGNSLKLFMDLTNDDFLCSSSEFTLKLIVGNPLASEPSNLANPNQEILSILINNNSTDTSVLSKLCPYKIHPKLAGFFPKEEISYTFKEPRKLPGPLLPYSFSILILSSLFIIFPIWNKLSKVDQGFTTFTNNVPLIKLATFISLAISLFIILCYWHTLNIFQFTYIFTPAVCIFFILLKLSLRNFTYPDTIEKRFKSD